MSDNPSFVLKDILDVEIQQKPVPESESTKGQIHARLLIVLSCEVDANEIISGKYRATGCYRMEPLSVAVHAVSNLGALLSNQSVAVFGCGPVGLLCMALAKALGASRIIAEDIIPDRLEFVKTYAVTDTFLPPSMDKGASGVAFSIRNAQEMKEKLGIAEHGPRAIDLVLNASGAEASIQTGIRIAKSGGTFVQVTAMSPLTCLLSLCKELVVRGSLRYGPGDYPLAIALVASGKVDVKSLVSHRFPFRQACEAFEITRIGKSPDGKGIIKVMISGPDVDINEV
ncbi:uncharacterized protein EDB93DRAFT_1261278 [Suillus bovinus]|uniref:uncharacterized protein n=1 Tax=Suillus bovinus TaxID=48563 RepID=UPI001B86541D|nr:uncharacterized protein EDB93DRAFT_1261278 [Suillus bovinus]KAG2160041.1 hypothetical protein EDB93DRAFT_1261278 [Suillus bovinus]